MPFALPFYTLSMISVDEFSVILILICKLYSHDTHGQAARVRKGHARDAEQAPDRAAAKRGTA